MSFSYHIEQKTLIEASCTIEQIDWRKHFSQLLFLTLIWVGGGWGNFTPTPVRFPFITQKR